ncbi:hypothetical protein HK099_001925 [Clydaea vesicula]|uniref:PIH1 N-terminal domain-containing protein n=1 Tax=Clydaea vesicula TaxID=447962 RepID=A0AAD5XYZ8_9FUNG|nr:hypothetical protein HK099_001925 [Clydaea vesicula]
MNCHLPKNDDFEMLMKNALNSNPSLKKTFDNILSKVQPNKKDKIIKVFSVKTTAQNKYKNITKHYINFCKTADIKKPNDELDIPIILSELRVGEDEFGPYLVSDCIFSFETIKKVENNESFKNDIIDLAFGCIKETFEVVLPATKLRQHALIKNYYHGPFGWSNNGIPIKVNSLEEVKAAKKLDEQQEEDFKKRYNSEKEVANVDEIINIIKSGGCDVDKQETGVSLKPVKTEQSKPLIEEVSCSTFHGSKGKKLKMKKFEIDSDDEGIVSNGIMLV